jgi:hypothetical protein
MIRLLLPLALVVATASTASADSTGISTPSMATIADTPKPSVDQRMFYVGGGVSARVFGLDSISESYVNSLEAYGYDDTGRFMMGMYLYGGYRALPIVDIGLVGEYAYIQNGKPSDKTISMRTHAKQLGVFARPRITSIGSTLDLGVRGEVGVIHSSTTLRQESLTEMSPYARAELELMVGSDRMGAHLHVGYMRTFSRDDFEPNLAPALGGMSFGVGVYRRY